MITRRRVLLAGGLGLVVAHARSYGQTKSKIPRIGVLWFGSMDTPVALQNRSVFRQRLAALGYVEGKNIVIEERSAEGHAERLGTLARELVASKVDIIVTPAVTASRAARQAQATNIRAAYRDLFRASETVRAAILAAEANCSGVACRSALSSSLSMAML